MTSPFFGPSDALPLGAARGPPVPRAGAAVVWVGAAAVSVCVGMPWRGLIFPPPGGEPYLATISGGAMIALLPRTRVVKVVGVLSSSTQTYSGSLGTSPNLGFLIRSHRVSADLIVTDGSPEVGMPNTCFAVVQPTAVSTTTTSARERTVMVAAIP